MAARKREPGKPRAPKDGTIANITAKMIKYVSADIITPVNPWPPNEQSTWPDEDSILRDGTGRLAVVLASSSHPGPRCPLRSAINPFSCPRIWA